MSEVNHPARHTVRFPKEAAGDRLDKVLARALTNISRTRIKSLILSGAVTTAGAKLTNPSEPVKPGQTVEVIVPPVIPAAPSGQAIELTVVYEDDRLIVIDKPAGLVVHPAPGNPDRTLVNALIAHCGDSLSGIGGEARPGIVHRLDKDTSGLLVAAKDDVAHRHLATQFANHSLDRAYQALVWGMPIPSKGSISGNIGRHPRNRKKMAVVTRGGKRAITHFECLRSLGPAISHLKCRLETGRTHQIRVHLSSRGCPVVGDPLYGGGIQTRRSGASTELTSLVGGLGRQALHACVLGFSHPESGRQLHFESPLPDKLQELYDVAARG